MKRDAKNVRLHSDRNKAAIKRSLQEVGAGRSILLDADETVIAGNGVLEQAEALGIPTKIVESDGQTLIAVKRTDLTGAKARRAAALDNIVSDTSAYDYDAALLRELANEDLVIAELAKEDYRTRAILSSQLDAVDFEKEWQGMPEFKQEEVKDAIASVIVHFRNETDVAEFARLMSQTVTIKTRYIWFPEQKDIPYGNWTQVTQE